MKQTIDVEITSRNLYHIEVDAKNAIELDKVLDKLEDSDLESLTDIVAGLEENGVKVLEPVQHQELFSNVEFY